MAAHQVNQELVVLQQFYEPTYDLIVDGDGVDGSSILSGTAVPTTEGSDGDFYIRTTNSTLYGPKASGTWPAGVSLIGAAGADGNDGADGSDGADGGAMVYRAVVATPGGTDTGVLTTETDITVTSSSVSNKVQLPAASIGRKIHGYVGDNGFELIPEISSGELVEGGRTEAIIPANTKFTVECLVANNWEVTCEGVYTTLTDIAPTINSWLAAERTVYLPRGEFYLDEPVVFGSKTAQAIIGSGRQDVVNLHDATYVGNSTRLYYRYDNTVGGGGADEPAITLGGSEIVLKDFALYGSEPTGGAQKNGSAILLTNTSAGLGDGKVDAHGIGFFGFEVGLQLGATEDEVNNDICQWERLVFRNCGDCIVNKNVFSMEHSFVKCQFRHDCTNSVRIHGGGHLSFHDCFVALPQVFLCFGSSTAAENNSTPYRVGPNNRMFTISNLKVDSQATATGAFKLVETLAPGHKAWIRFDRPSAGAADVADSWAEGNIDENMVLEIVDPGYTATTVTPFTVSAVAEPV